MDAKQRVSRLESEAYLERLKDWHTHNYYEWNPPILNEIEIKLPLSGGHIWKSDPVPDPWELLAVAVIRQAVDDYSEAWKFYQKYHQPAYLHTMTMLEETFFNRDDFTKTIFERLKIKLERKIRR